MNAKQQVVLIVAAVIVAVMLTFPPFRFSLGALGHGRETNIGYEFILSPPVLDSPKGQYPVVANVHWPVLLTQWIGVVLIAGMLVLAFRDRAKAGSGLSLDI